jgi:hypothetical protein
MDGETTTTASTSIFTATQTRKQENTNTNTNNNPNNNNTNNNPNNNNSLVNEIKNKIQLLKEKKENEKETSKNNELDIEVSKEFLNKFRKSRTLTDEDRGNPSSTQIKIKENENRDQVETKKFIEDYKTIEKFKSFGNENPVTNNNFVSYKKERSSSPLMNYAKHSGIELNSSIDCKKDEKKISKPLIDYEIQNLANKKPIKSFLCNLERYPEDK